MTGAMTNLGVQEGLRAETIMRYETTVSIEDENMTGECLESNYTTVD